MLFDRTIRDKLADQQPSHGRPEDAPAVVAVGANHVRGATGRARGTGIASGARRAHARLLDLGLLPAREGRHALEGRHGGGDGRSGRSPS